MDEVDKIILHSLRGIGCPIEEDITGIDDFSPDIIVRAASACLQQIKPNLALPKVLPSGMAQRFAVATALAEECSACGYRSDIGYQSFLYPNTVDVRRLFMFLIEQLPKEIQILLPGKDNTADLDEYAIFRREFKDKIQQQLRCPWVPQYCRAVGNRRYEDYASTHVYFAPQLNLYVPDDIDSLPKEVKLYLQQQAPSVFQQNAGKDHDLVSTVLHRNAIDLQGIDTSQTNSFRYSFNVANSVFENTKLNSNISQKKENILVNEPEKPRNMQLHEKLNKLKFQNDELIAQRKRHNTEIRTLKLQQTDLKKTKEILQAKIKVHERTCVVLKYSNENIDKLVHLVQTTQERRKALEQQWQSYRQPLEQKLQSLRSSKQAKNAQNVTDLMEIISKLEQNLRERTDTHAKFVSKLKNAEFSAAPRKEYTRRILEFVGNIRKQQNDIFKVLHDTRDLQKHINLATAQLERQFNYTDDLLFQSAKHDVHAKKAYKLLASLHAKCNELIDLVSQIGNVAKEIREVEVRIDRERAKNIAVSLAQILSDIQNFQNVIKSHQLEISKTEQKLSVGSI